MSISLPIFPTLVTGQSYTAPGQPTRGLGWSVKTSATWNNERQIIPSGRSYVVKYSINPLWKWEFKYDVVLDNPSLANPFYATPFPSTDFEILQGFYCGMQGQGNEFAYQPPDAVRGGSFTITAAQVPTTSTAILWINTGLSVGQLRLGDMLNISGLSTVTALNGKNGVVVARDVVANTVNLSISVGSTHAYATDSGTAVGGQRLHPPDGNGNIEIINTSGYYPVPILPVPTMDLSAVEAVQLLDTSTVKIYGNGTDITSSATLSTANTISPYQGVVAQFGATTVNPPVTASFTYYYVCRFSEDTQEFENFMQSLWNATVKIDQVRI